MKFYLEKFGWKSCSWEGHVLKIDKHKIPEKAAAGMLKRGLSRSFQQIYSSGKTEVQEYLVKTSDFSGDLWRFTILKVQ